MPNIKVIAIGAAAIFALGAVILTAKDGLGVETFVLGAFSLAAIYLSTR